MANPVDIDTRDGCTQEGTMQDTLHLLFIHMLSHIQTTKKNLQKSQ